MLAFRERRLVCDAMLVIISTACPISFAETLVASVCVAISSTALLVLAVVSSRSPIIFCALFSALPILAAVADNTSTSSTTCLISEPMLSTCSTADCVSSACDDAPAAISSIAWLIPSTVLVDWLDIVSTLSDAFLTTDTDSLI